MFFCILDLGLAMAGQPDIYRIHVFVDYWNFQLGIGGIEYKVDWSILGEWLARKAGERVGIPPGRYMFSGMNVYTSHDPSSGNRSHYNWVKNFLGGVVKSAVIPAIVGTRINLGPNTTLLVRILDSRLRGNDGNRE